MTERLRAQAHQQPEQRDGPGNEITAGRAETAREQHSAAHRGHDSTDAGDDQRNHLLPMVPDSRG